MPLELREYRLVWASYLVIEPGKTTPGSPASHTHTHRDPEWFANVTSNALSTSVKHSALPKPAQLGSDTPPLGLAMLFHLHVILFWCSDKENSELWGTVVVSHRHTTLLGVFSRCHFGLQMGSWDWLWLSHPGCNMGTTNKSYQTFTKQFWECHASLPATQTILASRMEPAVSIRTNMDSRNRVTDMSEKASSKLWLFSSFFWGERRPQGNISKCETMTRLKEM